ncbi:MAG: LD-carboxypeptidase [Crocinitomicaceae bacterium]
MKKWTRRELLPLLGIGIAGGALMGSQKSESDQQQQLYQARPRFKTPPKLQKGDTIGICAPAGALRRPEEVPEFTAVLNAMGFKVKVGKHVYEKYGYFAGTDEQRAADFNTFIQDEEVKGIFFLRGGWGCARILDLLDYEAIQLNRKVIMGFSDATSLLNVITQQLGIVTYHGPSGNSTWNAYSKKHIRNVLMSDSLTSFENNSSDHEIITYQSGKASGFLFGGNLSVITSLLGTSYFSFVDGSLLFLEEVGEEPYRIDRMLTQLKQAGIIQKCTGIILGSFRKCTAEEPDRAFTLEEVFEQHFGSLEIPVFYGAQIGHTVNKFTIPLGVKAEMDADKGSIQLQELSVG